MYFLLLFYKVGLGKDTYTWLVRRESVLVVSHVLIYVFKFSVCNKQFKVALSFSINKVPKLHF